LDRTAECFTGWHHILERRKAKYRKGGVLRKNIGQVDSIIVAGERQNIELEKSKFEQEKSRKYWTREQENIG
jgi:hypothetical protein